MALSRASSSAAPLLKRQMLSGAAIWPRCRGTDCVQAFVPPRVRLCGITTCLRWDTAARPDQQDHAKRCHRRRDAHHMRGGRSDLVGPQQVRRDGDRRVGAPSHRHWRQGERLRSAHQTIADALVAAAPFIRELVDQVDPLKPPRPSAARRGWCSGGRARPGLSAGAVPSPVVLAARELRADLDAIVPDGADVSPVRPVVACCPCPSDRVRRRCRQLRAGRPAHAGEHGGQRLRRARRPARPLRRLHRRRPDHRRADRL